MPQHFQLKASTDSGDVIGESLTMFGNQFSFKVLPISVNNGLTSIRNSIVLTHGGKDYTISLNHKPSSGDYIDPEPSIPKWSYVDDLYSSFTYSPRSLTPVSEEYAKNFQYGYVFVDSGVYDNYGSISIESINIGYAFTTESMANQSLKKGLYDKSLKLDESYEKICRFKMFYKLPTTDPITGDQVIPTDDGTPDSNRLRLPCKVEFIAPDILIDPFIVYRIKSTIKKTGEIIEANYDDWDSFRLNWDLYRLNPDFSDAKFYGYIYSGVKRNFESSYVGPYTLTIQEVAQEVDGVQRVFGAKPLYLYVGQLEVRTPSRHNN